MLWGGLENDENVSFGFYKAPNGTKKIRITYLYFTKSIDCKNIIHKSDIDVEKNAQGEYIFTIENYNVDLKKLKS